MKLSKRLKKKDFEKNGVSYSPDVVIRPSDQAALTRSWKKAWEVHSDPDHPEVKVMIAAVKKGKGAPVVVKEVKFKGETQRGLFAAASIKKGSVIGHYSGRLLPDRVVNSDSDYVFSFSEPAYKKWVIDGEKVGNHMRFINHSKDENIGAVELYYDNLPRIVFVAERDIKEGEQLLYSYGDKYWKTKGIKPQ